MSGAIEPVRVSLRPLAEADFDLLLNWLNAPHLKPFYRQEPISAIQVQQKYGPRLAGRQPCRCFIAELNGDPFGYSQWYLNADFPEYGIDVIAEPFGASIDYFVGSVAHLGRKLGSAMLDEVVRQAAASVELNDRLFFTGHRLENRRAIACSMRAGFSERKSYMADGCSCLLFARSGRPGYASVK